MRDLFGRLERALALGPGLPAAVEVLVDPGEPFELGLALSVGGPDRPAGLLLSYNPRARGGGARSRFLRALAGAGLPLDAARAAMSWVPDDRCSTVLGLEWRGGVPAARATLYLEEISRFYDPAAADRTTARLASLAGVPGATLGDDPGLPYIWALDLGPGGVEALKTYRLAAPSRRDEVLLAAQAAAAGALADPWQAALTGGVAASGYILQRRHRPGQAPPLKVYKTYAYDAGPADPAATDEVWDLCRALAPPDLRARLASALGPGGEGPPTSVGLRLAPGQPRPLEATAYWCLARGPGWPR